MCIVYVVWLKSRADYSDPWEGGQTFPLDELHRNVRAFLWSKWESWGCVQVWMIRNDWPLCTKDSDCNFFLLDGYSLILPVYRNLQPVHKNSPARKWVTLGMLRVGDTKKLTFSCSFLNEPLSLPEVAPRALLLKKNDWLAPVGYSLPISPHLGIKSHEPRSY